MCISDFFNIYVIGGSQQCVNSLWVHIFNIGNCELLLIVMGIDIDTSNENKNSFNASYSRAQRDITNSTSSITGKLFIHLISVSSFLVT